MAQKKKTKKSPSKNKASAARAPSRAKKASRREAVDVSTTDPTNTSARDGVSKLKRATSGKGGKRSEVAVEASNDVDTSARNVALSATAAKGNAKRRGSAQRRSKDATEHDSSAAPEPPQKDNKRETSKRETSKKETSKKETSKKETSKKETSKSKSSKRQDGKLSGQALKAASSSPDDVAEVAPVRRRRNKKGEAEQREQAPAARVVSLDDIRSKAAKREKAAKQQPDEPANESASPVGDPAAPPSSATDAAFTDDELESFINSPFAGDLDGETDAPAADDADVDGPEAPASEDEESTASDRPQQGADQELSEEEENRTYLKGLLEALLFATEKPMTLRELARAAKLDKKRTTELFGELRTDYARRGISLVEIAGGWSMRSNPEYGGYVQKMLSMRPVRLSRPQLETLAIIAYRQPITRPEIDDIRGVDSGQVIKGLLERELLKMLGKKDEAGRPMLYGTTEAFLELFSLESLKELPSLREFTELSDDSRSKFETEIGEPAPEGFALGGDSEGAFTESDDSEEPEDSGESGSDAASRQLEHLEDGSSGEDRHESPNGDVPEEQLVESLDDELVDALDDEFGDEDPVLDALDDELGDEDPVLDAFDDESSDEDVVADNSADNSADDDELASEDPVGEPLDDDSSAGEAGELDQTDLDGPDSERLEISDEREMDDHAEELDPDALG